MSVAAVCDSIAAISGDTTHEQIATIAKQCESFLGNTHDIIDVVENTLCTSDGLQRLALWYFVDRLAKQHSLFLDALRRKMVALTTNTAPHELARVGGVCSAAQEFLYRLIWRPLGLAGAASTHR